MYAVQKLARTSKIVSATAQGVRHYDTMVTKPRHRVSFAEKLILGGFLMTVPLLFPLYIATKLTEWTAASKEK